MFAPGPAAYTAVGAEYVSIYALTLNMPEMLPSSKLTHLITKCVAVFLFFYLLILVGWFADSFCFPFINRGVEKFGARSTLII